LGIAGIFAFALAGFVLLGWQQRRAAAPLFPAALVGQGVFRTILAISFLNSAAMFAAIFLLPLLLQWLYHATPAASGLDIVPFLATSTIGAFSAGQLIRHTGRAQPVMAAGVALAALGFLILGLVPATGLLAVPLCVSALFGLGIGAVMPTSLVAAQSQSGRADLGAATGMLLLLRAMGGAFGATLAGALLALAHGDLPYGFRLGFFACAGLQGMATLVALRMQDIRLRSSFEPAAAQAD
ncbi:MAG: hypothetical protein B7Z81_14545, partial [Acidocella sp. 20-61-6]